MVFPSGSVVKNLCEMQETQARLLGQEYLLEEDMATHSSILACRIPWSEEPGRLYIVHGVTKSPTPMHTSHLILLIISCGRYYCFYFPRRKQAQWGLYHTASMLLLEIRTQSDVLCHQDRLWKQAYWAMTSETRTHLQNRRGQATFWVSQSFFPHRLSHSSQRWAVNE